MAGGRREAVLDAAIGVLGSVGVRGLTHRAVDAAARLAAGSTSNIFRTRGALIDGIVDRLAELDRADWETMAARSRPADADDLVAALAEFVRYATGPARARTVARYGLFLEAAARPELREALARSRATIVGWGAQWLRWLGSPDPQAHTRLILDYLDGVILHQIAFPRPDFDPVPGIRAVLAVHIV